VLALALMAGLRSTAQGGMRIFLPLYVTDVLGLPLAMAGVALTPLALGGAVAAIPAGMASDRYGRRSIVMSCLAISSALIVILSTLTTDVSFAIGICLGISLFRGHATACQPGGVFHSAHRARVSTNRSY
jgi:MFS family permease